MTKTRKIQSRIRKHILIVGLLRGGLPMVDACEVVGLTPHQGRYELVKRGFRPRDIKASPDYARITFSKAAINTAIDLVFQGATPGDIFFVTGITMNRLLCFMASMN